MNFRHAGTSMGATTLEHFDKLPRPQVLVVDDAKDIRDCLSYILRSSGYRVILAEDGLAAQSILVTEHPSLVICDLEMPVSDGWEVLTYCHEHCPDTPVIIVSGTALGRHPEIERWAASFVTKPFSIERLRTEVARLLPRAA